MKLLTNYYIILRIWFTNYLKLIHSGSVKVNQNFSFSIFEFSISVLKSNLETRVFTPQKHRIFLNFNFHLTLFLSNCCFSLFVQASTVKPGVLNLFLSYCFLMLSSKRRFSNPAFQNSGSNPNWFWKPEKNPFQTWKEQFLVYFQRATGGFQLVDLILTELKDHMTYYKF